MYVMSGVLLGLGLPSAPVYTCDLLPVRPGVLKHQDPASRRVSPTSADNQAQCTVHRGVERCMLVCCVHAGKRLCGCPEAAPY